MRSPPRPLGCHAIMPNYFRLGPRYFEWVDDIKFTEVGPALAGHLRQNERSDSVPWNITDRLIDRPAIVCRGNYFTLAVLTASSMPTICECRRGLSPFDRGSHPSRSEMHRVG
jgi:hypothetical protein